MIAQLDMTRPTPKLPQFGGSEKFGTTPTGGLSAGPLRSTSCSLRGRELKDFISISRGHDKVNRSSIRKWLGMILELYKRFFDGL